MKPIRCQNLNLFWLITLTVAMVGCRASIPDDQESSDTRELTSCDDGGMISDGGTSQDAGLLPDGGTCPSGSFFDPISDICLFPDGGTTTDGGVSDGGTDGGTDGGEDGGNPKEFCRYRVTQIVKDRKCNIGNLDVNDVVCFDCGIPDFPVCPEQTQCTVFGHGKPGNRPVCTVKVERLTAFCGKCKGGLRPTATICE